MERFVQNEEMDCFSGREDTTAFGDTAFGDEQSPRVDIEQRGLSLTLSVPLYCGICHLCCALCTSSSTIFRVMLPTR